MTRPCWLVGAVLALAAGTGLQAADRLTVHEWGTFTCLQDETGRAVPGVNTDDEALPRFVHRLADFLIFPPSEMPLIYCKGIPMLHPQVTMRLETPVIYFYPPAGQTKPMQMDVRVQFRGGWLSEFYPDAQVQAPGMKRGDDFQFGALTSKTIGSLRWRGVQVGVDATGPETDYRVWLTPRQVRAAGVKTPDGEEERYLFYRGVGHIDAPLRVYRDAADGKLVVNERFGAEMIGGSSVTALTTLWLVDVGQDGAIAFREIPKVRLTGAEDRTIATFASEFRPDEYSPENLAELRGSMKAALLADGLYPDEAEAMLDTWELGYFKSVGMRLFFVLPRAWTDTVLPLELSHEADVVRTMVGRIELVTPQHRRLLNRIAQTPLASLDWAEGVLGHADNYQQLWEGRLRFAELGVELPPEYRDYLSLGRFRNSLVLDALAQKPDDGLREFVSAYRLQYYNPQE